jgi:hypothetical protein
MTGISSKAVLHIVFQHVRFIAYIFEQESPITVRMSRCPNSNFASPHGCSTFMQKLTNSHVSMRLSENELQEFEEGMQVAEGSSGNLAPCRLSYSASPTVTPLPGSMHMTRCQYLRHTHPVLLTPFLVYPTVLRFFFNFDHFSDGRTPWTSDQLVARHLPKHRTTQTQNKHIHIPNIHALCRIRTHDPGFRASEDSTCPRPLDYRDRVKKSTSSGLEPQTFRLVA